MRVTKLIREYVEKTVCEKIPMPEQPARIKELKEEWEETCNAILEKTINEFTAFFELHKGECIPFYCDYEGYEDFDIVAKHIKKRTNVSCSGGIDVAARREWEKQKKEVANKRKEVIDDILVSLELGANRAELEEMLSKIN